MRLKSTVLFFLCAIMSMAQQQWTGTWAIAMQPMFDKYRISTDLSGHSVRQILRTSIGGDSLRLKLSNVYSESPLEIASMYIAVSTDSCDIRTKTARYLTFGKKKNVTVLSGEELMSDAIAFPSNPLQRLAITINYARSPKNPTFHGAPFSTAYIIPGVSKPKTSFKGAEKVDHWYDIAALEVKSELGAIAAIGNSITDGAGCHVGKYERWTDVLAETLQGQGRPMGVLNLGIGANCVLREAKGKAAKERYDQQILQQHGVKVVIIFEGVNDICGKGNTMEIPDRLIAAYKQMIDKAHQQGYKVLGGTILPFGGHRYYTHFHEAARRMVNDWIRNEANYDAVIDFDAALRDPDAPTRMQEQYQSDWLHPNPAGYKVMGQLVADVLMRLDASSQYGQLIKQHCYADYKQMYKQPEGGALIYPYLTPGSKQYARVLWDWDSWLSNVALRQILSDVGSVQDKQEALAYEKGCVLNYLAYTSLDDGYMPMVVDAESDPAKMKPKDIYSTNMHKPVIAQHAAFITQQNGGNAAWLRDGFPKMQAFIANYQEHHCHKETGLFFWQDDLAIGVDNDPSTFFRPKRSSANIYLNCLMYKELQAMAYLAKQLSLQAEANQYEQAAETLRIAVRTYCWDERDGMYYSVDLNLVPYTGKPEIIFGKPFVLHEGAPRNYPCLIQRLGSWSGFMALWAGIATPEQAQRMVNENLLDDRTFWAPYGVRTLSRQEKMYNLRATHNPSNWQGPIWGISNYMVFRGLADYGFQREAREMAEKTIALFGSDLQKEGALHEYYNPETGAPIMNKGFQNWNYLVLNMLAWLESRTVVKEF